MAHRDDNETLFSPKFGGVVLVCRDCQKRSSGPSKLKAKDVRKALRRGLVRAPVRLRVVDSGCLGLCPKKAIALTLAAAPAPLLAADIRSLDDVPPLAQGVLDALAG